MEIKDYFFTYVLKYFDYLLIREKYTLKRINYSPIVDDDYELYYESEINSKIGVTFLLSFYHESTLTPIKIIFSRPKSNILNSIGIEFDGYYEWGKSRKTFSLEDVFKMFKTENVFKQKLTEDNLNDSIKKSSDFIQQYLMPVLRGEKWVDEI